MGKGVKVPETDEARHSFCCSLYCGIYTALSNASLLVFVSINLFSEITRVNC
jgi:hypothetical protein